jgi:hypothetical protein
LSLEGIGTLRAPSRAMGASSRPNPFSLTMAAAISAPQPPRVTAMLCARYRVAALIVANGPS